MEKIQFHSRLYLLTTTLQLLFSRRRDNSWIKSWKIPFLLSTHKSQVNYMTTCISERLLLFFGLIFSFLPLLCSRPLQIFSQSPSSSCLLLCQTSLSLSIVKSFLCFSQNSFIQFFTLLNNSYASIRSLSRLLLRWGKGLHFELKFYLTIRRHGCTFR